MTHYNLRYFLRVILLIHNLAIVTGHFLKRIAAFWFYRLALDKF